MKVRQRGNIMTATSEKEYERRWKVVREKMAEKDIDCILVYSNQMRLSGGLRYFIDYATYDTYGAFAIFPKEGGMAIFCHGAEGGQVIDPEIAKDADLQFSYPWAAAYPYTWKHLGEGALKFLKDRGYKKLGLYRSLNLPFYLVNYFMENIDGATLTDFDEELDYIKAVKSDEEIENMKYVCKLHEYIFAALPLLIRPGKSERMLTGEIYKLGNDLGFELVTTRIGSTPGGRSRHKAFINQIGIIQEGDSCNVLVESSGPGSYFGELDRVFVLGEPTEAQLKADADSLAMQDICASIAKPGVPASEIIKAMHKFQEERGYFLEKRVFAHGQGLDLVERPNASYEETMVYAENMWISFHPIMENEEALAINSDSFIITKDGAVRVTQTPRGLIVI